MHTPLHCTGNDPALTLTLMALILVIAKRCCEAQIALRRRYRRDRLCRCPLGQSLAGAAPSERGSSAFLESGDNTLSISMSRL
jgi:hypothetical protein